MKKTLAILLSLCYTGCSVNEEKDDRTCIDWGSYTTVQERCIPLYGQLICSSEEVTKMYCKLYDEGEDEILLNKS